MENLGAVTQTFLETGGPQWHNHKFLKIDTIVRMFATIEDIHHGHAEKSTVISRFRRPGEAYPDVAGT